MKRLISIILTILVISFATIKVNALTLEKNNIELNIGDTYQIEITDTDNYQNVSYESSLESVCEVSNKGLVTAKSIGSAVITITCDNDVAYLTVGVYKKTTTITLIENNAQIGLDQTYQIEAISDGSKELNYKTDSQNITVSNTGLITPINYGSASVIVYCDDVEVTFNINVVNNVSEITLEKTSFSLMINEEAKINVTSNTLGHNVAYESNNSSVVSVDNDGNIKALAAGSAIILVKIDDKIAYVTVAVSTVVMTTNITLKEDAATIKVSDTYQIEATSDGSRALNYVSNNTNIATVSETGLITALRAGSTTITVSQDNVEVTFNLTVISESSAISEITVEKTSFNLMINETANIVVTSDTLDYAVSYTSNDSSICKVDNNGLLTGVSAGNTTITVQASEASVVVNVSVSNETICTDITLNETSTTIHVGSNYQIEATSNGSKALNYASNEPNIASVDSNGLITANNIGETVIRIYQDNVEVEFRVIVLERVVTEITVEKDSFELMINESASINITSDTLGHNVSYSSNNPNICLVDNTGKLFGISEGTAVITITIDNTTKNINVNVSSDVICSNITLSETSTTIYVGNNYQIIALSNGTKPLNYVSNDSNIASVDNNGYILAKAVGQTTITISQDNVSVNFSVTVIEQAEEVSEITVEQDSFELELNESVQIKITSDTLGHNVTYRSEDPNVCRVSSTGLIEAINEGETNIVVSIDEVSIKISVVVRTNNEIPATSLSLNINNLTLNVGDSYKLTYVVSPINTTDNVTFETSDKEIVTISNNGVINALKEGSATITVKVGNLSASLTVNVVNEVIPEESSFNPLFVILPIVGVVLVGGVVATILVLKRKKQE